jgi:hypothetical protein
VNSPYDEKPHLVAKVKLVGEVVFARSVVESDIGALKPGSTDQPGLKQSTYPPKRPPELGE